MSVRKREWKSGGVTKSAWFVDYKDQHGKRRSKTFDRKKDADAYADTVKQEVRRGVHTAESQSLTIKQAGDKWIETAEANGRERSTIRPYRNHIDLHIVPLLGDIKLSRLNAPAIERFKTDLLRTRSRAMAKKVLSSLKMMLSDMARQGYIAQNVAAEVKVDSRGREKERVEIPSKAEINAILQQAAQMNGLPRPLLITAVFTGLRSSELRGLAWSCVDFQKKSVRVERRADQWGDMGAPKSAAGRRTVLLSPMVVHALKEWKLACPKGSDDLVFPNGIGRVHEHSNIVNRLFDPIQILAGVIDRSGAVEKQDDGAEFCPIRARYGFHCLRHFYASWLIEQNFLPKRVQSLLGHSSIQMTYDIYGHLFPNPEDDHAKLAAAEAGLVASLLHGAAGKTCES